MQWSVRNYLGDDKYPTLSRLYILLELTLQNNQGVTTKESMNMTLTEFKVIYLLLFYFNILFFILDFYESNQRNH